MYEHANMQTHAHTDIQLDFYVKKFLCNWDFCVQRIFLHKVLDFYEILTVFLWFYIHCKIHSHIYSYKC